MSRGANHHHHRHRRSPVTIHYFSLSLVHPYTSDISKTPLIKVLRSLSRFFYRHPTICVYIHQGETKIPLVRML